MFGLRLTTFPLFSKHAAYTINSSRRFYTKPSSAVELQERLSRGGRNLSERFRKLERTLQGNHNLSQTTTDTLPPLAPALPPSPKQRSTVKTFRGLTIPEVPKPPEPDGVWSPTFNCDYSILNFLSECCMSGCAVCVHDLYQESLEDYDSSVTAVRTSLTAMKVPVEEWPESIRPGSERQTPLPAPAVSLNAFKEMERALKARRGAQVQS